MIIKKDVPKHTQERSEEVTADVDLEDYFLFGEKSSSPYL